jgi:hypothetical protein
MPVNNTTWQPGKSANPEGRPPGARNRRTQEVLDRLKARGDLDSIDYMSSVVSNAELPHELRLAAAIAKAPYEHSKCGLTPQPAPLVYVAEPIALPYPKPLEIRHTLANIARLSAAWRRGELDQATFEAAIAEQRIVRDGLIEQAKLDLASGGPKETTVRIEGGLSDLPGTSFLMPGKRTENGMRIELVNGESVRDLAGMVPPVPVIPPEGSPLADRPPPPEVPDHLKSKGS